MLEVLVVDDEAPIRDWLKYCIESEADKFHVAAASANGKEAYELIRQLKPDVVITDIRMPGMDGIELMQEVKKFLPYTHFVILTNYADFNYAKQAVTFGAKEYILKSEMKKSDLTAVLTQLLEAKREIKAQKIQNRYPSGHVDIYDLYQRYEDLAFCREFWQELGINLSQPYCILGLAEEGDVDQRELLIHLAREQNLSYYITVLRQGIVYLVMQHKDGYALHRKAGRIARRLWGDYGQSVGVGVVEDNIGNFIISLEKVYTVLQGQFFSDEARIIRYEECLACPDLDRGKIREGQKTIFSNLSLRQYDLVQEQLLNWFSYFDQVNAADIPWAIEQCKRMVLSVEERFYHQNPAGEEEDGAWGRLQSLTSCREACLIMIVTMHSAGQDGKSKPMKDALEYIHKNYNRSISLVDVARQVYRAPDYFSRMFKEAMGENFSVYLMKYRLQKARELLLHTDMRISQIAYEVGYSAPGYFSRLYKKYMGKTPEEERKSK